MRIFILFVVFGIGFISCTDEVTLSSQFNKKELVVDAWLTTESSPQTIKLTYTQAFSDSSAYEVNNDALVTIKNINNNREYIFAAQGDGKYVNNEGKLATVNDSLLLTVELGANIYQSRTKVYRSAIVDSISVEKLVNDFSREDGYYAELYATDHLGVGDTYWIKTFKNDTLLNRASEINLVYDATFDVGSGVDGVQFIRPIRSAINSNDDDGRPLPYQEGDKIRCDIYSLSNTAFQFMKNVQDQSLNGDNTIFTIPITNSTGNVSNTALGIFNVAEVASITRVIE